VLLFALGALGPGLGAGWVRGGRARAIVDLRLRLWGIPWAAFALQVAAGAVSPGARLSAVVISYLALGVWLAVQFAANRDLRAGLTLLAGGWVLNTAAVLANGGMPVSRDALARAGLPRLVVEDGNLFKHIDATAATRLRWVGDIIPLPPIHKVVSVGDLLMLGGAAVLVAAVMARAARSRAYAPTSWEPEIFRVSFAPPEPVTSGPGPHSSTAMPMSSGPSLGATASAPPTPQMFRRRHG
jgi:hypothetical protein